MDRDLLWSRRRAVKGCFLTALFGLSVVVLLECWEGALPQVALLLLLLAITGCSTGMAIGWVGTGILLPAPADYIVSLLGSVISCLVGFAIGRLMQVLQ